MSHGVTFTGQALLGSWRHLIISLSLHLQHLSPFVFGLFVCLLHVHELEAQEKLGVTGHCDLPQPILGHKSRTTTLIMIQFQTNIQEDEIINIQNVSKVNFTVILLCILAIIQQYCETEGGIVTIFHTWSDTESLTLNFKAVLIV